MGVYRPNVYKVRRLFYLTLSIYRLSSQKLRCYLEEEHLDKKKRPFDFTDWVDHYDEVRLHPCHRLLI